MFFLLKSIFYNLIQKGNEDIRIVKQQYREKFDRELDLVSPKSFNEKLQWIKVFDKNPLYSNLVDKYMVRDYVKERAGDLILNEIYGIYENFDEINFDSLPEKFVIKATHGSGWNIICENKKELDLSSVKLDVDRWLSDNYYNYGKEFAYKNITPRIIIEKYIQNEETNTLNDYKFFCFGGDPRFIQVDVDRFQDHRRNFYDLDWKKLPFELHYKSYNSEVTRPKMLQEMVEVSAKLSKGLKFARVDLYDLDNQVVFGEITLYPGNGLEKFNPSEFDLTTGSYLKL